jgi:hypothetical protein
VVGHICFSKVHFHTHFSGNHAATHLQANAVASVLQYTENVQIKDNLNNWNGAPKWHVCKSNRK